MLVIWDTNVFVRDLYLEGRQAKMFFGGCAVLPAVRLGVPQIVLDELKAYFSRKVDEEWGKAVASFRRLDRILPAGIDMPVVDFDHAARSFEGQLRLRLDDASHEILPLPDVDVSTLAARAVGRVAPFVDSGKGLQDYLIWLTVLEAAQGTEPVALVTENTKDFGDGTLHAALVVDLKAAGVDQDQVELFNSLEAFNARYIEPRLTKARNLHEDLEGGSDLALELRAHLADELPLVVGQDLVLPLFDIPPGVGYGGLDSIWSVGRLTVDEVLEMDHHAHLVTASFTCEAFVRLFFEPEEVAHHPEVQRFLGQASIEEGKAVTFPRELAMLISIAIVQDPMEFSPPEVVQVKLA